MFVELLGILAAVLVLISMLFSNQGKLRIVNLVASAVFVAYSIGLLVTSNWHNGWATGILNTGCIIVHICWFIRNHKKPEVPAETNSSDSDLTE